MWVSQETFMIVFMKHSELFSKGTSDLEQLITEQSVKVGTFEAAG